MSPRLAVPPGRLPADFSERFMRLFRRAAPAAIKAYGFAECPPAAWTCSGVHVEAGDRATAMAALPADRDFASPARLCLRIGSEGTVIQGTGQTHSVVTPRSGLIEVAVHPPVSMPLPSGRPAIAEAPRAWAAGAIVVVIVWRESALRGLRYLAGAGDVDGLVRGEIHRLCNPAAKLTPADKRLTAHCRG